MRTHWKYIVSTKGNAIVLKHEPKECKINNYNANVMLAWQANIDIQLYNTCTECLCLFNVFVIL